MYNFGLVIMAACAVAYYRIGEIEYGRGFLLATLSVGLWVITAYRFSWGWIGCIGAQVAIFVVLTIINMFKKPGFK